MEKNIDIVRGIYEAFRTGDLPAALNAMSPQIEWNEAENFPYADGNPYVGPNAVVEGVFKRLIAEWEYWTLDIDDLMETTTGTVVSLGHYNAKNKKTGVVMRPQFAHIWWFEGGKAVRFQQYTDTEQAARAVKS